MPTHDEKKILPFTPEQMFDLVADVARYPEFLPWCVATRVRETDKTHLSADMVIGFKMFREQYTSTVTLKKPLQIDVAYQHGPFKYLENRWIFEPHGQGHCALDFHVDFEFRSAMMEKVIGKVFTEATRRMVQAFEDRAAELYG